MGDIQICSGPGWSEVLILRMATSTRRLDFSVLYLEKNGDLYHTIVFYASMSNRAFIVLGFFLGKKRYAKIMF